MFPMFDHPNCQNLINKIKKSTDYFIPTLGRNDFYRKLLFK